MVHKRPLGIDMILERLPKGRNQMESHYSLALCVQYSWARMNHTSSSLTRLSISDRMSMRTYLSAPTRLEEGTYQNNPAGNKTLEIITDHQLKSHP